MSNIIGKVKDAITGHDRTTDTTGTTGTPHRTANSGVGTTTDTSATGRTAGPHRSDVANKLDREYFTAFAYLRLNANRSCSSPCRLG